MKLFFKKVNKLGRGFTLVETLVAVSIFTVSILGLLSVLSQGISDTGYAKKKVAAGYLAQEGIECIRNTRDNYFLYPDSTHDWGKFVALNVSSITCPTIDSGFTRVLGKTVVNLNEVKITSRVDWTQGSGNYNITFSENLFNWVE